MRTLAIGDGGNDVNMIQEAHVGVGIEGREGQQAARAADYSIGQFRHLKTLMLVHGHLSFYRTSFIAQYSFYKSLAVCCIQLLYAFMSSFSGSSLFNSLSLMGYNVFYTGFSALFFVLDRNVDPRHLINWPQGYAEVRSGVYLSKSTFVWWFVRAVYQALATFAVIFTVFSASFSGTTGRTFGDEEIGLIAFSALVWIQILTVTIESSTVTFWNAVILGGTLVAFYIFNTGFSLVPGLSMYSLMFHLFCEPIYWLAVLFAVTVSMIPVLVIKYHQWNYAPSAWQKHQWKLVARRKSSLMQMLSQSGVEMSSFGK